MARTRKDSDQTDLTVADASTSATHETLLRKVAKHSAVRYLFIGGASFLLDFGLLALLHEVLAWPLWLATAVAFLTSFVFNYTLQRTFSFGSRGSHVGSLVRYLTLLAFNTLATIAIVAALDALVGWGVGKVVATCLSTVWTYFAYKHWVFKTRA